MNCDQNRSRAVQSLPVVGLHPAVEAAGASAPSSGVGNVPEVLGQIVAARFAEDGVRFVPR